MLHSVCYEKKTEKIIHTIEEDGRDDNSELLEALSKTCFFIDPINFKESLTDCLNFLWE